MYRFSSVNLQPLWIFSMHSDCLFHSPAIHLQYSTDPLALPNLYRLPHRSRWVVAASVFAPPHFIGKRLLLLRSRILTEVRLIYLSPSRPSDSPSLDFVIYCLILSAHLFPSASLFSVHTPPMCPRFPPLFLPVAGGAQFTELTVGTLLSLRLAPSVSEQRAHARHTTG